MDSKSFVTCTEFGNPVLFLPTFEQVSQSQEKPNIVRVEDCRESECFRVVRRIEV